MLSDDGAKAPDGDAVGRGDIKNVILVQILAVDVFIAEARGSPSICGGHGTVGQFAG